MSPENLDGGGSHIQIPYLQEPRFGIPYLQEPWGGSHICRKPRSVGYHICMKPRWGGDPISAGNLEVVNPIPAGSKMWDPISAGNLDGGIPYL